MTLLGNAARCVLLFALVTALPAFAAGTAAGIRGLFAACGFSLALHLALAVFGPPFILRACRARALSKDEAPEAHALLYEMGACLRVSLPRLFLVAAPEPFIFTLGFPGNTALVISAGLLKELCAEEFQALIAHELAHCRRGDVWPATQAALPAAALGALAALLRALLGFGSGRPQAGHDKASGHPLGEIAAWVLHALAGMLIRLGAAPGREYAADQLAGKFCGNPLYLAGALRKLDAAAAAKNFSQIPQMCTHLLAVPVRVTAAKKPVFKTHPDTEERMVRLEKMARESGL